MIDTLGLLAEAAQVAADLGYQVREEPLGDLPGGACTVAGRRHILVNLDLGAADRLDVVVRALAEDPRTHEQPLSRLLASRLAAIGPAAKRRADP